jgi:cysteine desulfurase
MSGLRDRLVSGARSLWSGIRLNGTEEEDGRLPNTANLSFPGIEAELLVQALDLEGVAVSAGAACTSGATAASEVLSAMGLPEWRTKGAIRVSVGPRTAPEDVDRFLEALAHVLPRLRIGPD